MHPMVPIELDIGMLLCFREVAESGSFTKAGNNIGLTQAGVSTKIRRLEERLDAKVFNRTSKNLSLTLEGELLLDYARRILFLHDEAVNRMTRPKASGQLRIGLIDYFLPELLPGFLSRFTKQYPNVHLDVHTEVGTGLIPAFEKGELDLVVAGKDGYEGRCRIIFQEPLIWAVGKNTDVYCREIIPLVMQPSPCHFRKLATENLEKEGRKWEIIYTATSTAGIQTAVQAGIGISVLPMGALKEGMIKAPIQLDLPDLPNFSIALFMDEKKKNDARDVFISYLESELKHHKPSVV